jgi:hypothetical protein
MAIEQVRTKVSPLDFRTPIVDENGCPTLQFLRLWQQLFGNDEATNESVTTVETVATDALTGLDLKADKVTQIIAGTGLTGGGDLATDRTLNADPEFIYDTVVDILQAGSNITLTPNDGTNEIEIASSGGGGGGGTPTVRAGNAVSYASASSFNHPFPTGTVEGDVVVICGGSGWGVNTPAGWTTLQSETGANANGALFAKVMTAGDIAAGQVTITTVGGFEAWFGAITLDGATVSFYITSGELRSSSGATSFTCPITGAISSSDLVVAFAYTRGNIVSDITNSGATSQGNSNGTNASGCSESFSAGSSGLFGLNVTGTFASSGTGYYIAAAIFRG